MCSPLELRPSINAGHCNIPNKFIKQLFPLCIISSDQRFTFTFLPAVTISVVISMTKES
uniref:Uncharacterized protein n=1 Tax=Meloidogyne incognita TaxID=6306 RepID=A0A914LVR5_MELIC